MMIQLFLIFAGGFIVNSKNHNKNHKLKKDFSNQGDEQLKRTFSVIDAKGNTKEQTVTEFNPNKKLCSHGDSPQEKFCNSLTDCAICNKALNCGYCASSKRCLAGNPNSPFCEKDCLVGWVFDGAKCSNLVVFGNVYTTDYEARELISPDVTGPKIKLNVQQKNHLKTKVDVLAGQQQVLSHTDKDGVVNHKEVQSPIRYQLYTTMPTETIDQSYIFDQNTGKRLDAQVYTEKSLHGASDE